MKLMDQKGRLFGKIHLLDLLIALLLIAGIIGMGMRFAVSDDAVIHPKSATYTIEFTEKEGWIQDAYKVGDTLWEKGENMGTVTKVEVFPHQSLEVLPNGSAEMVEHAITYDVILTVETDNIREHDGTFIGSQEFLSGTGHTLSNGFISCGGKVRSIDIKE